jgi:hypothetical protein
VYFGGSAALILAGFAVTLGTARLGNEEPVDEGRARMATALEAAPVRRRTPQKHLKTAEGLASNDSEAKQL